MPGLPSKVNIYLLPLRKKKVGGKLCVVIISSRDRILKLIRMTKNYDNRILLIKSLPKGHACSHVLCSLNTSVKPSLKSTGIKHLEKGKRFQLKSIILNFATKILKLTSKDIVVGLFYHVFFLNRRSLLSVSPL